MQKFGLKLNNMKNFHPLEVVGRTTSGWKTWRFSHFKTEFTIVIVNHCKSRIATAIRGLQWMQNDVLKHREGLKC